MKEGKDGGKGIELCGTGRSKKGRKKGRKEGRNVRSYPSEGGVLESGGKLEGSLSL